MLRIKNAYVTDPRSGMEGERDIWIKNGKILRIVPCGSHVVAETGEEDAIEVIDAQGMIAAPGLIDVHVHFRDPGFTYKEDIESGSKSAAKGGFTTVILMANTRPVVDNEETLSYVLEKGKQTKIHVKSCCAVTKGLKGKELTDMASLLGAGAVGFTDDGIPLLEEKIVRLAMERAAELGTVLSFHEEDPAFIQNNGINAGGTAAAYYGIGGADRKAEITMAKRDVRLAKETGAEINMQHISSLETVEIIRQAKKRGVKVHAEASPHHFTLTEEAAVKYGTLAKMNPPLRREEDRLAIIKGLKDGTIDLIATDHAPHSREEKEKSILEAPSGIIGLETALPLGITGLVKTGHLSMQELLLKMTWNPAKMYHLDAGYLAEGGPADLVLFDADEKEQMGGFVSKSSNSPFAGMELMGVVRYTICDGKIVYRK